MSRLRSPIKWFGGKGLMVAKLLPLLSAWPHRCYVEPFGGGASILIAKAPAEIEVYNDLDGGLVNFFRVLSDPRLFRRFFRRIEALPYARGLYDDCRRTWTDEPDPVIRAAKWFVVARQSFSGMFGKSWGRTVTTSSRGMARTCSGWMSAIDLLPEISARLRRVQIEQADWHRILDAYDSPETLFYCDPPYAPETRSVRRYAVEMTAEDHADLARRLTACAGGYVVSGYDTPLYAPLDAAGCVKRQWRTVCHATGHTKGARSSSPRTEVVWISPQIAAALDAIAEAAR